jgi:hypothetical protein
MSFGVSIGDVILVSQLSYKCYQSITAGRKGASRDLEELGDVLFGLRCALNHLQNVVEDISRDSSATQDVRAIEMRDRLGQMIQGCASTLEDLDSATSKYRVGAVQDDTSLITVDEASASESAYRTRLRRRLAANMTKIRWDMDKSTFKAYRDKLQAHADAINLVLNTFLW